MNLQRFRQAAAIVTALLLISSATAQEQADDKVDLDTLAQIKTEAFQHSQVMENLYYMSEVYGPRVTNSRNHRAAAEWAMKQMKEWGLQNVHLEQWPFGYGWQIKKFYGAMETPAYAALIGFPLAWTPGTNGPITADAAWAPIHSKEDFAKYKGKLKGKVVLMFDPPALQLHTRADATPSPTDEEILARGGARGGGRGAVADGAPVAPGAPGAAAAPRGRGRAGEGTWEYTPTSLALAEEKNHALRNEVNAFMKEEGVAVVLTPGYNGDGGTIFSTYGGSQDPKDPVPPPMVAITPEQYNRIVRLLQHGTTPKLTFDVAVEYQKDDLNAFNVIGEIPGTTRKDEIVMLGGHFDSWQGGTGATDNGTGSSVAMEAVRILATLHKPMARTRCPVGRRRRRCLWFDGLRAAALCSARHHEEDSGVRPPRCVLQRRWGLGQVPRSIGGGQSADGGDLQVLDRTHQRPAHRRCLRRGVQTHTATRWHGLEQLLVDRPERHRFPAGWAGVRHTYPPLQHGPL